MVFNYKKYEEVFPRKQEAQPKKPPAKNQPMGNALEEAEEPEDVKDIPDENDPDPDEPEGGEGDGTE